MARMVDNHPCERNGSQGCSFRKVMLRVVLGLSICVVQLASSCSSLLRVATVVKFPATKNEIMSAVDTLSVFYNP